MNKLWLQVFIGLICVHSQSWAASMFASYTDSNGRPDYATTSQYRYDKSAIHQFSKDYRLVFFISSTCSYCHAFAPTVKTIAEQYGLTVQSISLDGYGLPEYPDAVSNQGVAERLGVRAVPALFAVKRQSGQAIPLAFGLISATDLEQKIAQLARAVQRQNGQ